MDFEGHSVPQMTNFLAMLSFEDLRDHVVPQKIKIDEISFDGPKEEFNSMFFCFSNQAEFL